MSAQQSLNEVRRIARDELPGPIGFMAIVHEAAMGFIGHEPDEFGRVHLSSMEFATACVNAWNEPQELLAGLEHEHRTELEDEEVEKENEQEGGGGESVSSTVTHVMATSAKLSTEAAGHNSASDEGEDGRRDIPDEAQVQEEELVTVQTIPTVAEAHKGGSKDYIKRRADLGLEKGRDHYGLGKASRERSNIATKSKAVVGEDHGIRDLVVRSLRERQNADAGAETMDVAMEDHESVRGGTSGKGTTGERTAQPTTGKEQEKKGKIASMTREDMRALAKERITQGKRKAERYNDGSNAGSAKRGKK